MELGIVESSTRNSSLDAIDESQNGSDGGKGGSEDESGGEHLAKVSSGELVVDVGSSLVQCEGRGVVKLGRRA